MFTNIHSFILETYIEPLQETTTQRRSQPSHTRLWNTEIHDCGSNINDLCLRMLVLIYLCMKIDILKVCSIRGIDSLCLSSAIPSDYSDNTNFVFLCCYLCTKF